jgi:hypothetical protein
VNRYREPEARLLMVDFSESAMISNEVIAKSRASFHIEAVLRTTALPLGQEFLDPTVVEVGRRGVVEVGFQL